MGTEVTCRVNDKKQQDIVIKRQWQKEENIVRTKYRMVVCKPDGLMI